VDDGSLGSLLSRVFAAEGAAGVAATYFELMIAAAALAFSEAKVDVALCEVGMGGRWDATNALDPILTVLTNVALDHTEHLGGTLEAIAAEKLCTARDGRPLVLGPGLDPAWLAPLCGAGPIMVGSTEPDAEVLWGHSVVRGRRIGLAGRHQIKNLATALAAVDALRGLGWALDADGVWDGVSRAEWPGRLWTPPGMAANVVLDGAHNAAGAAALAGHLTECRVRPRVFFSAMGDKDMAGMARALASAAPLGVTLGTGEGPRCAAPGAMRDAWAAAGHPGAPVITLDELALKLREKSTDTYLVTGSLYFLGNLLKTMGVPV
jgi:dihydrofolate synthase/folylpolyglutamate synthase